MHLTLPLSLPNKLGLLLYHPDLVCQAKSVGSYLQSQGHSVGSNPKKIFSWSSESFATKLGIVVIMSKIVMWQFWIKVTVRVQNPQGIYNLSWHYLLNHGMFLNETWYVGVSSWPGVSSKKFWFLSSRSRSQCGLKYSKSNCLFHSSSTFEPFATKHGIMMHHQRLECFTAVFDCSSHGQDHSEGWTFQRTHHSTCGEREGGLHHATNLVLFGED